MGTQYAVYHYNFQNVFNAAKRVLQSAFFKTKNKDHFLDNKTVYYPQQIKYKIKKIGVLEL